MWALSQGGALEKPELRQLRPSMAMYPTAPNSVSYNSHPLLLRTGSADHGFWAACRLAHSRGLLPWVWLRWPRHRLSLACPVSHFWACGAALCGYGAPRGGGRRSKAGHDADVRELAPVGRVSLMQCVTASR